MIEEHIETIMSSNDIKYIYFYCFIFTRLKFFRKTVTIIVAVATFVVDQIAKNVVVVATIVVFTTIVTGVATTVVDCNNCENCDHIAPSKPFL